MSRRVHVPNIAGFNSLSRFHLVVWRATSEKKPKQVSAEAEKLIKEAVSAGRVYMASNARISRHGDRDLEFLSKIGGPKSVLCTDFSQIGDFFSSEFDVEQASERCLAAYGFPLHKSDYLVDILDRIWPHS